MLAVWSGRFANCAVLRVLAWPFVKRLLREQHRQFTNQRALLIDQNKDIIDLNAIRDMSKVAEERGIFSLLAPCGHTTIKDLVNECHKPMSMDADEHYEYVDEKLLRIVIEVSNAQQPQSLEKRAWQFLHSGKWDVARVIGFDLEYKRSKQASFV